MKKYLLLQNLVLLLLTSYCAAGQTIRFTDTTNKWQTEHTSWPDGYPNYGTKSYEAGDTLVEWDGKQYTVIRSSPQSSQSELWVREDTLTRKIYLKAQQLPRYRLTDTNEFLYMDFSLAVGDSITMPIVSTNAVDLSTHTVTHVDSVLIGSQWYKRLRLATRNLGYTTFDYYEVTEGIGPFSGPLIETRYTNEWGPYKLRCFSNKGVIPNPPFSAYCFDPVSIDKKLAQPKSFTVYPNPAAGKITVRSKAKYAKGGELTLSDITGRRILISPLNSDTEIATKRLRPGLYLLRILQQGVVVQVEKVVVR